MLNDFYSDIRRSSLSTEDKEKLIDFLENESKYDSDVLSGYTSKDLEIFFQIAKAIPGLIYEMWLFLPDEIANNPENVGIFERILDDKFGDYINGIDKKALIRLLNTSRSGHRSCR